MKTEGGLKLENIISMKNVRKDFKETKALKNVTFNVKEGEVFGFLGPSGAGKTTTIKLLTSQLIPTSGEAKVFGKDVYANKKDIFKNIGVLSDTSGIYDRLSVRDNLTLYADIYGVPKKNVEEKNYLTKMEISLLIQDAQAIPTKLSELQSLLLTRTTMSA